MPVDDRSPGNIIESLGEPCTPILGPRVNSGDGTVCDDHHIHCGVDGNQSALVVG